MRQRSTVVAKAGMPALAATAVAAVAFSVTIGAPFEERGGAQGPTAVSHQQAAAEAAANDPSDPSTWRLPIEAYMPTRAQAQLIGTTREDQIDVCMSDAGYANWTPAPDLPEVGGKTLTDWRYGVHDAGLAAEYGYHPDAQEQQAYDTAMEAGAVDKSGADQNVLESCVTQAGNEIPPAGNADLVQQISGDSYLKSEKAPSVVDVFAKWSSCMKEKGYSYAKPMDANDDPSFTDPTKVSKTEIATATADIECRDKFNVEKTWFDAEVALQQTAIARNRDALDEAMTDIKSVVAKAKAAADR
ncbi:hypothetical protein ACFY93_09775 [Streptomyces sp. NPDC008313]|uniref:hypothetical protein n=1 Tax=Streptomyces sp. NPDC008313 TaxID=3364826 RepID=UPI0036E4691B